MSLLDDVINERTEIGAGMAAKVYIHGMVMLISALVMDILRNG